MMTHRSKDNSLVKEKLWTCFWIPKFNSIQVKQDLLPSWSTAANYIDEHGVAFEWDQEQEPEKENFFVKKRKRDPLLAFIEPVLNME